MNLGCNICVVICRNVSLWTPLDCAAAKGWMKTAKVLLEADSPIDPMDKAKVSVAHFIVEVAGIEMLHFCIEEPPNCEQIF